MNRTFYIGCAIWSFKDWVGDLYPQGSRASDFLKLYSQRLTAVEGNTTFYSVPSDAMVQRWKAETPSGFKFCLKLPRDITHQGELMPRFEEAIAFLNRVQPLGDRLGPFFIQLPPSYSPARFADLKSFLTQWDRATYPISVEVRHLDWFRPQQSTDLNAMLRELGVGRVLLDSRPMYQTPDDPQVKSERKKPQVPLQPCFTANFSIVRYISHPDQHLNRDYLAEWTEQIHQWLEQGITVYFFVHCPIEARSPGLLRGFQHQLEQTNVPVESLPWDSFEDDAPAQLSLFS
ncbi:MAG: DUF72 domain-containing protein [Elainellaceae cyanobacterium]